MNHEYFQDRLSGYHDGDLTPDEMQVLRRHVDECAECRAQLEQYQRLDRLVADKSGLGDNEYWEESAQKIEARLGIEVASATEVIDIRSGRSWMGWKVAGTIAAVLALTFVGLHQTDILRLSSGSISETPASPAEKIGVIEEDNKDEAILSDDQDLLPKTTLYHQEAEPVSKDAADQDDSEAFEPVDEMFASGDAEPAKGRIRGRETGELSELTVDGVAAEKEQETPTETRGDTRLIQPAGDSAATSAKVMGTKDLLDRFSVSDPAKSPAPTKGEPSEIAAETAASKTEIKKKPVTSVGELLSNVAGAVVKDESGEIFIRGGRAGEAAYFADSSQVSHVLAGFGTDSAGKRLALSPPWDDIDHWRSVRDSLEPPVASSQQAYYYDAPHETKDYLKTKSASKTDQRTLDYVEAIYHIGRLTDDEDEYHEAMERLGKYRKNDQEDVRKRVKRYLELLEGRFE
ncbi:MAG: zf-HC2 domain-containing protein [bacterium]